MLAAPGAKGKKKEKKKKMKKKWWSDDVDDDDRQGPKMLRPMGEGYTVTRWGFLKQ